MGLLILLALAALVVLLVIRSKVVALSREVEAKVQLLEDKLLTAASWAEKGGAVVKTLKKVTGKRKK